MAVVINPRIYRVTSQIAGVDFADFKRYVQSPETLPRKLLDMFDLKNSAKEPFNAGLSMQFDNPRGPVIENVRNNSPAEAAGLQSGDEVVTLGGRSISKSTWLATLARYKSGDSIPITVKRNRRTIKANMVLTEPERLEYKIEERADVTAEQKALRASWLSGVR